MNATRESPPRAVVVGAGVAGCAVARTLAQSYDVTVLEAGSIGGGASGRAAGLITVRTAYAERPSVGQYALQAFKSYDGSHFFEYHETPSYELRYEANPSDWGIEESISYYSDAEIPVKQLGPDKLKEIIPGIDVSDINCGLEIGETGWVDPHSLVMAYKRDAEGAGVEFRTNTQVTDLQVEQRNGKRTVCGVETSDGSFGAEIVVLATGWATSELLPDTVSVPLRPYRTQCVVVEFPDQRSLPMGWVPSADIYFRPTETPGQLLVGGGSAHEDNPKTASREADASFRREAAAFVEKLFVKGGDARIIDEWAGIDVTTPDGFPILDIPPESPDGLVLATGLHGRGIMTAPLIGPVIESLVREEDSPVPTDRFQLNRFDDPADDFEFVDVSA